MHYINEYFSLDERVLDELERRTPRFGYNGFGEFVFFRTYSRTKHNGRQENWADVVTRVINGVMSIRKDWYVKNHIEWDEKRWQDYASEMAHFMFDMKWLPPGRGLWAMGTPFVVERGAMALYNCFSGDTKFLNNNRLSSLQDLEGREVRVICEDGQYRKAIVNKFGRQGIVKLKFRPESGNYNSNYRFEIKATRNHRWLLSDGSITDYIVVGNKITAKCNKFIDKESCDFKSGYVHGLIFADGTQDCRYPERFYLRLCNEIKQEKEDILKNDSRFHLIGQQSGDPRLTFLSQDNLKDIPDEQKSLNYKAGFFHGWRDFDGYNDDKLDTSNAVAAKWLEEYSGILGYVIVGKNINNKATNFGERTYPLQRYTLASEDIEYRLVEIVDFGHQEEVYCVTEPETSTFMLNGGFVTGNCAFTQIGNNSRVSNDFHWLMDSLMLGVGVGFEALRDDLKLYRPSGKYHYVIPDTREGWCDSVKLLLDAYTQPSRCEPVFDYSELRAKGQPIKGFGGLSSGPEPLVQLHDDLRRLCTTPGISSLRLKTDIANKIGVCVVAGNVRRSAELAKGRINDREFLDLKDYDMHPERESFGWMSNNTVALEEDNDFELLGEVARRVVVRGEPGILNLRNFKYGRIGKPIPVREDMAIGLNPCGEIPLEDKETCNISETLPTRCANDTEWLRACEFACFYSSTVSLLPTHRPETNAVIARNRRIGVGIIDITGWIKESSMNHVIKMMRSGYEVVRHTNRLGNGEAGVPESIRVTTVKPGGTVPKVAGKTPGNGFPTFEYTIMNVRVASNAPVVGLLKEANVPYEPEVFDPKNTLVFKFPVLQGPSKPADQVSLWEQAVLLATIQREWADNAVSNTLYFRPAWQLEKHITDYRQIGPTLSRLKLKLTTEQRRSLRTHEVKKIVLTIDKKVKAIIFYEPWPMEGQSNIQLKVYKYDPNHEEDIIETVLSSFAPLIKSCSLLPHSAKGVYRRLAT